MSMVSRRNVYESQLKAAKDGLAHRANLLKERKLDEKATNRDPVYKKYKGEIRQVERRIKALNKVDAVNTETTERRAAKAAAPKVKKVKKKVPVEQKKPKKEKAHKGPPAG